MNYKLLCKVVQREEGMTGIQPFWVFTVAAFNLAVMTWCVGSNQFMANTQFRSSLLK